MPNLCPLPLYFCSGSLHDLWIPVSTSSLTADAFKVMDPRVSKSKVFNLLLISQLPKWQSSGGGGLRMTSIFMALLEKGIFFSLSPYLPSLNTRTEIWNIKYVLCCCTGQECPVMEWDDSNMVLHICLGIWLLRAMVTGFGLTKPVYRPWQYSRRGHRRDLETIFYEYFIYL